MVASFFSALSTLPEDPILGLQKRFLEDQRKDKLNVGIGIYPDKNGDAYLFRSVANAEMRIAGKLLPKNYQLIEGDKAARALVEAFIFGEKNGFAKVSAQTLGGTGALRIAAELAGRLKKTKAAFPFPTWSNYKQIFGAAGLNMDPLPYWDRETGKMDKKGLFEAVERLDGDTMLVLQGPCHNPTGLDFSYEECQTLSSIVKEKGILLLLDIAYLGFAKGLDKDLKSLEPFFDGECFISLSFSKTLGLYGDRVGFFVAQVNKGTEEALASHIRETVRSSYSSPPLHGNLLIKEILGDPELIEDWLKELQTIRALLIKKREQLFNALEQKNSGGNYQFIKDGHGMFTQLDIPEEKILSMRERFGIYLPLNGRINIAGFSETNIPYFVDALFA